MEQEGKKFQMSACAHNKIRLIALSVVSIVFDVFFICCYAAILVWIFLFLKVIVSRIFRKIEVDYNILLISLITIFSAHLINYCLNIVVYRDLVNISMERNWRGAKKFEEIKGVESISWISKRRILWFSGNHDVPYIEFIDFPCVIKRFDLKIGALVPRIDY